MGTGAAGDTLSIDEAAVGSLSRLAGLNVPAERLPDLTVRFRELYAMAQELDSLNLDGIGLPATYDPTWAESGKS